MLSFALVGAVLVIRVPENRVSWTVLGVAAGFGLFVGLASVESTLTYYLGSVAVYGLIVPSLGIYIPLWVPTGRPPSPRWQWVGWLATVSVAVILVGVGLWAFVAGGDVTTNPNCSSPMSCTITVGTVGLMVAVGASVLSLLVRWIRARGVERLQLRWLMIAFVLFFVGFAAEFGFSGSTFARLAFPIGTISIPVSIGWAVTRYRLYDLERIVSRTVTYALVATAVALVYAVPVVVVPRLLGESNELVVAGSTLAAAAAFNPARRRIQRAVDHRFNRARYDAEREVDAFADRLTGEIELVTVAGDLDDVVRGTLAPSTSALWLRRAP